MIGIILLSIALTAFAYMAFPVIRLIMNGEKFEAQRAKTIALWNSIVVGFIFLVAATDGGRTWSGGAAILYYYINRAMLTNKKAAPRDDKSRLPLKTNTNLSPTDDYDKLNADVYMPGILRANGEEEQARQLEEAYEAERAKNAEMYRAHMASLQMQAQSKFRLPLGACIGIAAVIVGVITLVIALAVLLS